MKRMVIGALAALYVLGLILAPLHESRGEESQVTVTVDGIIVTFPDQQPYFKDERLMVPVRAPMEAMGALVSTYTDKQGVEYVQISKYIDTHLVVLKFVAGSSAFFIDYDDGRPEECAYMDVSSEYRNDRVCLPIRYAAENLGYIVKYNDTANTVEIISRALLPDGSMPQDEPGSNALDPGLITIPGVSSGSVSLNTLSVAAGSRWWNSGAYKGSLKNGTPFGYGAWTIPTFSRWGRLVINGSTESCSDNSICIKEATVTWDCKGICLPNVASKDSYSAFVLNATVYIRGYQSSIAGDWIIDYYHRFDGTRFFNDDGTMSEKGSYTDDGKAFFEGECHYRSDGTVDTMKGKYYDETGMPSIGVWKFDESGNMIDSYIT